MLCLMTSITGCAHAGPNLHGKLWQGDSVASGVTRKQDAKTLKCSDPTFDQYTCEKTQDLIDLGKACKEWY